MIVVTAEYPFHGSGEGWCFGLVWERGSVLEKRSIVVPGLSMAFRGLDFAVCRVRRRRRLSMKSNSQVAKERYGKKIIGDGDSCYVYLSIGDHLRERED